MKYFKNITKYFLLTLTLLLAIPWIAEATINPMINYQGRLTDNTGTAVSNGDYNMRFRLYTAASGGSPIFTETLTGNDRIGVVSGLFSVMVGSSTAITSVDFDQTLYLGVEIGGTDPSTPTWDGEMSPRKIIGSVPTAFVAQNLNGGNATTSLLLVTSSTTLQSFTAQNGTTTNATSTSFYVSGLASTTNLRANVASIGNLTVASCTGCGGGGSFAFPFTTLGSGEQATSTTVAFLNGFLSTASSTLSDFTAVNATTTNATSTNFAVTTLCLIGDTCRTTWPAALTFAFPWTTLGTGENATSTTLSFQNGFLSLASSTIGGNTVGSGLTIRGGATTTDLLALGSTTLQNFTFQNATGSLLSIYGTDADGAARFSASSTAGVTLDWIAGVDLSDSGKFKISSSTVLGTNDRFVINGSGNIGIGTSNPASSFGMTRFVNISGTNPGIVFTDTDQGDWELVVQDYLAFYVPGGSNYPFRATQAGDVAIGGLGGGINSQSLVVKGLSGYTGIGTTTPQWLLQLSTSTAPQLTLSDPTTGANHWSFRSVGGLLYLATSSPTSFATSTVSALTIDEHGNATFPLKITANAVTAGSLNGTNLLVTSLSGAGTRCVQVDNTGLFAVSGSACGSAAGTGGGSWATTTSQTSSYLNYSLNDSDVIAIGSSSTTTAEFYFDPNLPFAKINNQYFGLSSTTLQDFTATNGTTTNATSTTFAVGTLCLTGDTCRTTWPSSGGSFAFPWTTLGSGENSTSTTLVFGNGFVSGASSTLTNFLATNGTTTNATSTSFYVSGLASTTDLRANTGLFGNVGIGTTTPQWSLNVAGTGASQLTLSDSGSITSAHWSFRNAGGNFYLATSSPTTFATSSAPALTILATGGVGIGTSSPYGLFTVVSPGANNPTNPLIYARNNNSTTGGNQGGTVSIGGSATNGSVGVFGERLRVTGTCDGCSSANAGDILTLEQGFSGAGFRGGIVFASTGWGTTRSAMSRIVAVDDGAYGASLALETRDLTNDFSTNGQQTTEHWRFQSKTGNTGFGTTTPRWLLQLSTTSAPQLTLSDSGSITSNHWSFRNSGGLLYLATSSPTTFATSTVSSLTINENGIVTIANVATTTQLNANVASVGSLTVGSCVGCQTFAFPFTTLGTGENSTSTTLVFGNGFVSSASSTLTDFVATNGTTTNATSTTLYVSGLASTTNFRANTGLFGNIGVGTTTPQWIVNIAGTGAPQLTLSDSGSITANHWSFRNAGGNLYLATSSPSNFASSTYTALTIFGGSTSSRSGNVGIGQIVPDTALEIMRGTQGGQNGGWGALSLRNFNSTAGGNAALIFINNPSNYWAIGHNADNFAIGTTASIGNGVSFASTPFQIAQGGQVGIGTSTPQWSLQISSSTRAQLTLSDPTTGASHWSFRNVGGFLYLATSSPATYATTSVAALSISNSGLTTINPAMSGLSVNSTGQVGIRTTSPLTSSALNVYVDASSANSTNAVVTLGTTALSGPSANGTFLGANALSSFTGNFMDLQTNGTREFSMNYLGEITTLGGTTANLTGTQLAIYQPSATVTVGNSGDFGTGSNLILQAGAGGVGANLDFQTDNVTQARLNYQGFGIGTTTPRWLLQLSTTSASQLTLSDSGSITSNHWSFRNAGGLLYLATSSPTTFATSTVSALTINENGIVTIANIATTTDLKANTATIGNLTVGSCTGCGGSTFAFPFTTLGTGENATSTTLALLNGFVSIASSTLTDFTFSTATGTSATTTGFAISGLANTLLSVNANGSVIATSTIGNNQLQNSTISGIALGSNLADLTATNGTLTFSGTYNGGTARTIGLNLGNANDWTALQTFTNSSSTLFSSTIASTSQFCIGGDCRTAWPQALTFAFPFTTLGTGENATSTTLVFGNGFISSASSTLTNFIATNGTTTNATSTNFYVAGLASTTELRANTANLGLLTIGTSTSSSIFTLEGNLSSGDSFTLNTTFTAASNQRGLYFNPTYSPSGASSASYLSAYFNPITSGANFSDATLKAVQVAPYFASGGTLTELLGIESTPVITGGGTVTNAYGLKVGATPVTSGTLTNNFGAYFVDRSSGTNNAQIVVGEASAGNNSNLVLGQTTIPTGSYSIYNSSTDLNYFAGALQLNSSTTLQNFTASNSTTTSATSTSFYVSGLASTTNLRANVATIGNLTVGSCTGCGGAGTFAFPFTTLGTGENATSTTIHFSNFLSTGSSTAQYLRGDMWAIGTTTARWPLQIASSTAPQLTLSDPTATLGHWSFRSQGGFLYIATSSPTSFATSTFTALTINQNGQVGIGTTTPTQALEVSGNIQSTLNSSALPTRISSLVLNAGENDGKAMAVVGKYAYIVTVTSPAMLVVVDVSNPSSPTRVGSLTFPTGDNTALSIVVSGRYAYVTIDTGKLAVVDISNPTTPVLVGSITTGNYNRIVMSGKYIYGARPSSPVIVDVIDVSNPADPVIVGSTTLNTGENNTKSVEIRGNHLFVGINTSPGRVVALDVSNPTAPIRLGALTLNTGEDDPRHMAISGKYLYIGSFTSPAIFTVVDISNPSAPTRVAALTLNSGENSARHISAEGRYAYVTLGTSPGSMAIIDISNPANPVRIGAFTLSTGEDDMRFAAVSGRYTYITTGETPARLVVADTRGLETTSLLAHSIEAGGLQVKGNAVFNRQVSLEAGLSVGPGGLYSQGALGIFIASTTASSIATSTKQFAALSVSASSTRPDLFSVLSTGSSSFGTSTPKWLLQLSTTSAPQLTLSDSGSISSNHWSFRNSNGILYLATSSPTTFATSTVSALSINENGIVTIGNVATTTQLNANVASIGNLTVGSCTGCSGASANSKWATSTDNVSIYPNSAVYTGIGTTTPKWLLQLSSSTAPQLTLSDSTAGADHWSFRNQGGFLYLATSSPTSFATSSAAALSIDSSGNLTLPLKLTAGTLTGTNLLVTSLAGSGTRCVQVDNTGLFAVAGAACGTAGSSSGGTWATTTSQTSSYLNYSLNDSDVVAIGSSSTTTSEFYFDPNVTLAKLNNQYFGLSSTTLQDFTAVNGTTTNATSTNLEVSGIFSVSGTATSTFGGPLLANTLSSSLSSATGLIFGATSSPKILTLDTINSRVQVGDGAGSASPKLFVLDTKNTSGDPTGINGAMYYNSNSNLFRCYKNSSWVNCGANGTSTVSIFNAFTNPDTGGNAWFEPYTITATNDNFGQMVAVASSTSAKTGFYGTFHLPEDYSSNAMVTIYWTSPIATGDVVWDFDYRAIGGDDAESLDQATFQESVTITDTAPSAVDERNKVSIKLTDGNFAAGDTVEFLVSRDGADVADTMASGALIHDVIFEYLK